MTPMKLRMVTVVVVAALVASCGSTPVTSSPVTTNSPADQLPSIAGQASPEPTATPSPTAVGDALRFTWSEVPFEGSVSAITDDGSRFVAVGTGTEGVSSWTSSDGMAWEEHDVPDRSFGEIGDGVELTASMGQLIRLGDTLYSFGGMTFMDSAVGAAWRWTDGSEWEVIESTSDFFGGRPTVATASDKALVVGNISFERGLYGTYSTWRWTAATSWVKTALSSSADEVIGVDAIAWGGDAFVAAGSSASAVEGADPWDWPRTLSIWTSRDGRDWTAVEPPDGMSSVCSLAALPAGGFVALGTAGERIATWTSLHGDEWMEGTFDPQGPALDAGEGPGLPCRVVAAAGGLLAAVGTDDETLTWTSIDGRSWAFGERLDIAGVQPANVAALGDHVLLFGSRIDPRVESGFRHVLSYGTAAP
jgi:hypothetical protein